MLLCQNLSGHHDRTLMAIFHTGKKSQHCHDGLTGTHVSLDQTIHYHTGSQILPDILPCSLLPIGQIKRQPVHELFRQLKRIHLIRRRLLMLSLLHLVECQRKKEEFFKYQPPARLHIFFLVLWKMNRMNRLLAQDQIIFFTHF